MLGATVELTGSRALLFSITLAGSAGRFRLIRMRFHSLWPRIGGTVARFDGTISFALYY